MKCIAAYEMYIFFTLTIRLTLTLTVIAFQFTFLSTRQLNQCRNFVNIQQYINQIHLSSPALHFSKFFSNIITICVFVRCIFSIQLAEWDWNKYELLLNGGKHKKERIGLWAKTRNCDITTKQRGKQGDLQL